MKEFDFSSYIVAYNFVIGVLLMLASEKVGHFAGYFMGSYKTRISRIANLATFAFGGTVAALMGSIYVAFHLFKF
jgi:hypothetical protein